MRGGGGGHINDCRVFAAVTHFITGRRTNERTSEWSISRLSWTDPIWGSHSHSDVAAAKSFAGSVRSIPSNRSAHKSRCKSEKRGHHLHKRGIRLLDSLVSDIICLLLFFQSVLNSSKVSKEAYFSLLIHALALVRPDLPLTTDEI